MRSGWVQAQGGARTWPRDAAASFDRLAALCEPLRRNLYFYVADRGDWASRNETAGDHPVWHRSERDVRRGHQHELAAQPTVGDAIA